MPLPTPIVHADLADVLTPILLQALRGVTLSNQLTRATLSRYLATELGPYLEWAAFAGALETIRPGLADPTEATDRIEEGLTAFCLALRAGPPVEDDRVPLRPRRMTERRAEGAERRCGERRHAVDRRTSLLIVPEYTFGH